MQFARSDASPRLDFGAATGAHAAIAPAPAPLALLTAERERIHRNARRILASRSKRLLDLIIASAALLLLAPLFAMIAASIKATSRGPVFFRQQRYGARGSTFRIWKFRTMHVMESNGSFAQAMRSDARVTSVGRWLRKTSLDELPQLLNVLQGTMSLVGPRPHAVVMDDHYASAIPTLPLRHLVRPGLTGLAQIGGYRGPTDTFDAMAGRVDLDVDYILDWSLLTDLSILARTPVALLRTTAF